MFDPKDFVVRAGMGLEAEDRFLLGAGQLRNEPGGLLREKNERFYQFVVYRSILSAWPAKLETQGNHDLVIGPKLKTPIAIIEMKRWMSPKGETEIPPMKKDIAKLNRANAHYCGLMVFSANPAHQTDDNVAHLESELFKTADAVPRELHRFKSQDDRGKDVEFWTALWGIRFKS